MVQKSADWIAEFSGSIPFLLITFVVFGLWLLVNWIQFRPSPVRPYPFGFLTLAVSLEAIFLRFLCSSARIVRRRRIMSARHRHMRSPEG